MTRRRKVSDKKYSDYDERGRKDENEARKRER
jgi:hypothetical protein